ncbi:septum formation initiator family protein [candidate division KSB1 bacterium]
MFLRGLRQRWELRRIRNYLLLGLGLWFFYVIIASEQGILRILSFRNRIEETAGEIKALETVQDSLKRELTGLENNLDLVEKHAREELGMVKPGEVVYKLVPSPKTETPEADGAEVEGEQRGETQITPAGR